MCGSMADMQSAAAEIRWGKKKKEGKNKLQHENIMVCPIPLGDIIIIPSRCIQQCAQCDHFHLCEVALHTEELLTVKS